MKKFIKYFFLLALGVLVVMQFFRINKNEDGYESVANFEAETTPGEDVALLLRENCYDCHSNQTNYPWYAEIAPISYWLQDHVKHGKGDFNVSEWASYSIKKKDHKLEELIEEIEKEHMPLDSYTWIHGSLTEEEKKILVQWATLARLQYRARMETSAK